MSRITVVCLTFAFLLVGFAAPLQAQDLPAEATESRPGAETASANAGEFDASRIVWAEKPRPDPQRRYWKGIWIATWAAFVAVNILDAHSSAGRREANPLLRDADGVFSGRKAIVVKSAAGGGFLALQSWLAHKNPGENHYKTFAIATGAVTAGLGVVAARNYGVLPVSPQAAPFVPAYVLRRP
jgi:hypothetical protein